MELVMILFLCLLVFGIVYWRVLTISRNRLSFMPSFTIRAISYAVVTLLTSFGFRPFGLLYFVSLAPMDFAFLFIMSQKVSISPSPLPVRAQR